MPSVEHLKGLRRSVASAARILVCSITGDNLHAGVLLQPRCEGNSTALRQEVHRMMLVAVDQDGSVGAALAEGKIVDGEDTGRRGRRDGDRAGEAQQGVWTSGHGLALALTRSSFTAKRQAQRLQGGSQVEGELGRWGEQARQGLGEGLGGAGHIETAPPPHVQQ
ncbi:MAG TPA: hypothetical protein VLA19_04300 [Herpetosiphonaceae bacterium]|nr:hypothetical protein [Herpetosiphonaceae bacterium]